MPASVRTAAKKKMVRVDRASQKGALASGALGAGLGHQSFPPPAPAAGLDSRRPPRRPSPWCPHPARKPPLVMTRSSRCKAAGHLHVIGILQCRASPACGVPSPSAPTTITDLLPSCAVRIAAAGIFHALCHGSSRDGNLDRRAHLERARLVVDLEPDLDRRAAWVERRTDERDFGGDRHRPLPAQAPMPRRPASSAARDSARYASWPAGSMSPSP